MFSSAPSIYENEDIKKGILLQLFGGNRKDFTNTGRGKFRCVYTSFDSKDKNYKNKTPYATSSF